MQSRRGFWSAAAAVVVTTSLWMGPVLALQEGAPAIVVQSGVGVSVSDTDMAPEDPTGTSLLLSRLAFPDGAGRVLIARDDAFADALAGGVLQDTAPLLLVGGQQPLAAEVLTELDRLGADQAVILGGTAAVGTSVADSLTTAGLQVRRLAGATRLATAATIAQDAAFDAASDTDFGAASYAESAAAFAAAAAAAADADFDAGTYADADFDAGTYAGADFDGGTYVGTDNAPDTVILTRAFGDADDQTRAFADALAAGALAAETGWPVLLTDTAQLSIEAADALAAIAPSDVVIVGGDAAVAQAVASSIQQRGITTRRLSGPTRVETAQAINAERVTQRQGATASSRVIVIDGTDPDAWTTGFASAALAAAQAAPVILSAGDILAAADAGTIADTAPDRLLCDTTPSACEQARRAAGLPPAVLPTFAPAPGQTVSSGDTLQITLDRPIDGAVTTAGDCLPGRSITPSEGRLTLAVPDDQAPGPCVLTLTMRLPQGLDQRITAPFIIGGDLTVTPAVLAATHDYATDVLGDPWDYDNVEDILLEEGPTIAVSNARLEDGMARFTSNGGYVHLLWAVFPGALPIGRDGAVAPISGDHYREIIMRVRSSVATHASVAWQTCPGLPGQCDQSSGLFQLQPGWQTIRLQPGWSGAVYALRFGTTGTADIDLDDVRIITPGATATIEGAEGPLTVTVSGGPSAEAGAERGLANPAVGTVFDTTAVPAGTYTLTDASGATATVQVVEPPRLRIQSPDITGGQDYATATTGDAWDLDQVSDATTIANAGDISVTGGVLRATNTSNDPFVDLRMGPVPLDPARFHRVTVTFGNDGPLDLGFGPGGGSHARLLWTRVGGATGDSEEIVAYPQYATYTFSMRDPATTAAGVDWTGGPISQVRFDPNEDPGPRRWYIDDLSIRADDESTGAFAIELADVTPATLRVLPTSVSVSIDGDRGGFDGTVVANGVALGEGTTQVAVTTCGLAPGTYWVHATATRGPTATSVYATGPLQVTNTAC